MSIENEPEPADTPETEASENHEAARWRTRLRDTEAERDQLAGTVEALQRSQAEHLIAGHRIEPAAVFAVTELPDLLDDTGCVDPGKVSAAVHTARQTLGINAGLYVPAEGANPSVRSRGTFTDAFAPPQTPLRRSE